MPRDPTIAGLVIAFIVLAVLGGLAPDWLAFLIMISLARGLVVLGILIQMRAGLVSFGQGLYYCLGGYAAGSAGELLRLTDAFVVLALGVAVAVAVAAVLGLLLTRYRHIFFGMLSLAFSMLLYGLLLKTSMLGSSDGFNVPKPTFAGLALEGGLDRHALYLLTLTTALVAAIGIHRYLVSTLGFLGEAIRDNEVRVEYLGVSVRRALYIKYLLAAGLAGAGGALTAFAVGHVDPEMAYWTTSGEFVFVALFGGIGSVAAPFLGSGMLELVRTFAFQYAPYTWQIILGLTMLLVILFLPGGLWSVLRLSRKGA